MSWIATPESSNIAGFEYNNDSHVLIVEFSNGVRYGYYDVPEGTRELLSSVVD